MGFGVWGLGFRDWGLGLGFRVWGLGFGFRVWGLGFGVWGLGFRASFSHACPESGCSGIRQAPASKRF